MAPIGLLFLLVALGAQATLGSGDVCGSGYLSSTNRLWTLAPLPLVAIIETEFLYTLNLCGAYGVPCATNAVICQISTNRGVFSLGDRTTGTKVQEVSDTEIDVAFTHGDTCGSGRQREVVIKFVCAPASAFSSIIETQTCNYSAIISVNESLCRSVPTTTTALATSTTASITTAVSTTTTTGRIDACAGYVSPSQRYWNLRNLPELAYSDTRFNYTLNPCGQFTLACGTDSALCQKEFLVSNLFSLGQWTSFQAADVSENSIAITFSNGSPCNAPDLKRQVKVTFICAATTKFVELYETARCNYFATVTVAPNFCYTLSTLSSSSLGTSTAGRFMIN